MQSHMISDDEDLMSPPSSDTEQEWSEEDDIPMIGTGTLGGCSWVVAWHLQGVLERSLQLIIM